MRADYGARNEDTTNTRHNRVLRSFAKWRPPQRDAALRALNSQVDVQEKDASVRRSQFSESDAYRKALAAQRRKRRRTEAQLERNLNRSDIEELSGDENDDPDFFSDLLSFAAADAKEREEKKEE